MNKTIADYILLKLGLAFIHIEVNYKCKKCGSYFVFQCDQDFEFCSYCGGKNTNTKEENEIVMRRNLKD